MTNELCSAVLAFVGALTGAFSAFSAHAQPNDDNAPPPAIRAWMDRLTVKHAYDPETGFIVAKEVTTLPQILAEGPSLDEAIEAAGADGKIVVAFATADRCAPCQQYKKSALNDPHVVEALGRADLVTTHVEVDREPQLALSRLGSLGIPMTYALHNGERIAVLRGQRSPEELLAWIDTLPSDPETAALLRETNTWHTGRIERLKAEDGWLSLVGLEWLDTGPNRVGRDPKGGVVYNGFPADHLATLHVQDGAVGIEVAGELPKCVVLEGVPAEGRMRTDTEGSPSVVTVGGIRFHVVERGGKLAVRIKDAAAETRTGFRGIDRYPVSTDWRITARFEPATPGRSLRLETVVGVDVGVDVAGYAHFERNGHTARAVLSPASNGAFYLRFADATCRSARGGAGTYPIGRYLYVPKPSEDGTVVLDFNRAYNPPCAFTPFATCTMAPEPNEFPFPINAGETWTAQ